MDIPNISYDVFEAMMRFVYTGQLDVTPDIAFELLQVRASGRQCVRPRPRDVVLVSPTCA